MFDDGTTYHECERCRQPCTTVKCETCDYARKYAKRVMDAARIETARRCAEIVKAWQSSTEADRRIPEQRILSYAATLESEGTGTK